MDSNGTNQSEIGKVALLLRSFSKLVLALRGLGFGGPPGPRGTCGAHMGSVFQIAWGILINRFFEVGVDDGDSLHALGGSREY